MMEYVEFFACFSIGYKIGVNHLFAAFVVFAAEAWGASPYFLTFLTMGILFRSLCLNRSCPRFGFRRNARIGFC